MADTRWYPRSLTSLSVLAGFLIMSVSGVVAFLVPQGRVAYWTEWTLLGLTKEQWGDIHILSSLIFVAAGAVHIYYNWRPLTNYLGQKATAGLKHRREIFITIVISIIVVASAIYRLPPLSYLLDFNSYVKELWVVHKDFEPPFGHAELLSFKVFCQKTSIPLEQATATLKAKGLTGVEADRQLRDIARANTMSPLQVYRLIRHLESQPKVEVPATLTAEKVEEMFAGTGIGNKTIVDLAKQLGKEPQELTQRLAKKGIAIQDDLPLKQLANKAGLQPLEVIKAALVDSYQPR